jgi:hypothetical protein
LQAAAVRPAIFILRPNATGGWASAASCRSREPRHNGLASCARWHIVEKTEPEEEQKKLVSGLRKRFDGLLCKLESQWVSFPYVKSQVTEGMFLFFLSIAKLT